MDDGPSSMKKWKNNIFLIDRRAISDYLTWRHPHSHVADDLAVEGYDSNDVEQLCTRLFCLREKKEVVLVRSGLSLVWSNQKCYPLMIFDFFYAKMSIYDSTTLPSWGDAKAPVKRKAHSFPAVSSGPSQPPKRKSLRKKDSEAGSSAPVEEPTEDMDDADLSNFCTELEDSMKRNEGTSSKAVFAPPPRFGKRLGSPH
ncbi:hypothetical protein Tco_1363704 [Tanacetum coccineum]